MCTFQNRNYQFSFINIFYIASLYEAVRNGNAEIVKILLASDKVNVNKINITICNNTFQLRFKLNNSMTFQWIYFNCSETALHLANKEENIEIIKLLLTQNIDINILDDVLNYL